MKIGQSRIWWKIFWNSLAFLINLSFPFDPKKLDGAAQCLAKYYFERGKKLWMGWVISQLVERFRGIEVLRCCYRTLPLIFFICFVLFCFCSCLIVFVYFLCNESLFDFFKKRETIIWILITLFFYGVFETPTGEITE